MKKLIRKLIDQLLTLLPLPIYRAWIPRRVVGLFYHAVSDARMPHVDVLYPPVTAARFEAALRYLKRNFNVITYEQLHAHRQEGAELPPRALHLSFDDGFAECATLVMPLLQKHGLPCTFFVTTDWLDNQHMFYRNKVSLAVNQLRTLEKDAASMVFTHLNHAFETRIKTAADFEGWIMPLVRADEPKIDMVCKMLGVDAESYLAEHPLYLTREQVREMHAAGFTIGSHTLSHPKLVQVSAEEMEAEIVGSSRIVQEITGQETVPFSFPNSATGLDRNTLAEIRARHPFLGLFFDTKGLNEDEAFIVNRIWAEKQEFAKVGLTTNVPALLRWAYALQAWEVLRGKPEPQRHRDTEVEEF